MGAASPDGAGPATVTSAACDVLVVGAGPTGVALGALLARAGVEVLIIDKEIDVYPLPRAAHIDHEAIRIFQQLGLAEKVMATTRSSERYDFLSADGDILMRFEGGNRIGPGGWPAGNMIHQPSIERLLRQAAVTADNFTLKTGWSWRSHEATTGRLLSSIETPQGDVVVSSRFLVGCDGARSPVRQALSIEVDDLQFDEAWLVIDALVIDPDRLPKVNLQICDPARPTTCVLMGSGRHRWEFMLKPGETPDEVLQDAFIQRLLEPWNVESAMSVERKAVYRFNAKVARAWRDGAVFLAGDAAHVMPPFAGQGLCSGLRDAANLAWKIAAVLRGADDALLDTYQQERDPHVRAIIQTAIMMGRTVCITDPDAARERDARMLAGRSKGPPASLGWPPLPEGCLLTGSYCAGRYFPQPLSADDPPARLDDALGPGAWLISRTASSFSPGAVGLSELDLSDSALAPFRQPLASWLDEAGVNAVLVRPDRYVFGSGDASALKRAWLTRTA